jgi:hypothetical protein
VNPRAGLEAVAKGKFPSPCWHYVAHETEEVTTSNEALQFRQVSSGITFVSSLFLYSLLTIVVCSVYLQRLKEINDINDINEYCHLPKDCHFVETHVAGGKACELDLWSYARGSISSWQDHPSQTGQRVGARLSVVYWSSRLGVGRGANNYTS